MSIASDRAAEYCPPYYNESDAMKALLQAHQGGIDAGYSCSYDSSLKVFYYIDGSALVIGCGDFKIMQSTAKSI